MRKIDQKTLNTCLSESDLPYEVVDKLPASGQREVYVAVGLLDKKNYIIKVSHCAKYNVPRIQREIRILNKIKSNYFPKFFFDAFVAKENFDQFFDNPGDQKQKLLAEEYQASPINPFYLTIEDYIENIRWEQFTKSLNEKGLCNFLRHCFNGLSILWDNKIVHRDVKPENILICLDGIPAIIDLGIAKSFNDGTEDLTPDLFLNPHTKRYASPEQLMDRKKEISYKTDQYSVGIIAYNALCGDFPFGRIEEIGPHELLQNMISFKYKSVSESGGKCCSEFEELIKKLLRPEPHQRYRTIRQIHSALDKIDGALL